MTFDEALTDLRSMAEHYKTAYHRATQTDKPNREGIVFFHSHMSAYQHAVVLLESVKR